jgi:hypothetical protein
MKRFFMRAGIVSVAASVAILGGTVTQAMAAPVKATAGLSATSSTTVERTYVSLAFTSDEAMASARRNLAAASKSLRITCTERSIEVLPLPDFLLAIYGNLGNLQGVVTADCSG